MQFTPIVTAATALALSVAGVAAGATRVTSPDGGFTLVLTAQLRPAHLAASELAPASLHVGGRIIRRGPAAEFPEMRQLTLEADENVNIDVRGIPVCRMLGLPPTPPPWNHCKDGIVGHGKATIIYAATENAPVEISSETVVYNGGVKGDLTNLWIRAYFPLPQPHTSLARVKVRRIHRGRFRSEVTVAIPRLGERFGSLASFDLTLDRKVISASCSNGHRSFHGVSVFEVGKGEVELPFASAKRCNRLRAGGGDEKTI